MSAKPTILCVDDDTKVLDSMKLNLRKQFRVLSAPAGAIGLDVLRDEPDVAIVLSDMRMPEMDGAEFLALVKDAAPTAVRMLLTGYSDIDAAMRAVNEGEIFRFLTKPCPPEQLVATLMSGVEQHRLITAERVLLQRTLLGSVKAVVEIMALQNPMSLGRAVRIRDTAKKVAACVDADQAWRIELAAMLSQVGMVTLPDETVQKIHDGETLDEAESRRLNDSMTTVNGILHNIPRLEPVTELLDDYAELMQQPGVAPKSTASAVLRAAIDLDSLEAQGLSFADALQQMQGNDVDYGARVLESLASLAEDPGRRKVISVGVGDLEDGMELAEDLKTSDGIVILPRGFVIDEHMREHIGRSATRPDVEVRVVVGADSLPDVRRTA